MGEEQGGGVGAAGARRRRAAGMFAMTIEDDGPGIPEDKAREALKRGKRLDETKPGTALAWPSLSDLVSEYGGKLALERSTLGGLRGDRPAAQAIRVDAALSSQDSQTNARAKAQIQPKMPSNRSAILAAENKSGDQN